LVFDKQQQQNSRLQKPIQPTNNKQTTNNQQQQQQYKCILSFIFALNLVIIRKRFNWLQFKHAYIL